MIYLSILIWLFYSWHPSLHISPHKPLTIYEFFRPYSSQNISNFLPIFPFIFPYFSPFSNINLDIYSNKCYIYYRRKKDKPISIQVSIQHILFLREMYIKMGMNQNHNNNHNNHNNHSNHQSKSKIQFTIHSRERGYERIGISNKIELRDMVANARFKGNNINSITIYNYEKLGLTYEELVNIKRRFSQRSNSDRLYYYKGYIFIFFGKDAMSLKTIIKLNINSLNINNNESNKSNEGIIEQNSCQIIC